MIDENGAVVHELDLPRRREDVFAFLTDPARLVNWIGLSAELEPVPGGRFRFEVQPGQYCEGWYVEVEPPRRVVFSWGWTDPSWDLPPGTSLVEVELTEVAAGTRLRLVHHRLPGDLRPLHDEGWTAFLGRLAAVSSGAEPGAYPTGAPTLPTPGPRAAPIEGGA